VSPQTYTVQTKPTGKVVRETFIKKEKDDSANTLHYNTVLPPRALESSHLLIAGEGTRLENAGARQGEDFSAFIIASNSGAIPAGSPLALFNQIARNATSNSVVSVGNSKSLQIGETTGMGRKSRTLQNLPSSATNQVIPGTGVTWSNSSMVKGTPVKAFSQSVPRSLDFSEPSLAPRQNPSQTDVREEVNASSWQDASNLTVSQEQLLQFLTTNQQQQQQQGEQQQQYLQLLHLLQLPQQNQVQMLGTQQPQQEEQQILQQPPTDNSRHELPAVMSQSHSQELPPPPEYQGYLLSTTAAGRMPFNSLPLVNSRTFIQQRPDRASPAAGIPQSRTLQEMLQLWREVEDRTRRSNEAAEQLILGQIDSIRTNSGGFENRPDEQLGQSIEDTSILRQNLQQDQLVDEGSRIFVENFIKMEGPREALTVSVDSDNRVSVPGFDTKHIKHEPIEIQHSNRLDIDHQSRVAVHTLKNERSPWLENYDQSDELPPILDDYSLSGEDELAPQRKRWASAGIFSHSKLSETLPTLSSSVLYEMLQESASSAGRQSLRDPCSSLLLSEDEDESPSTSDPAISCASSSAEFRNPTVPAGFLKFKRKNRPEPLVILSPRFHSQLRSPRIIDRASLPPAFMPYTPPPMLSPVRRGSGLFCNTITSLTPKSAPVGVRLGQRRRSKLPTYVYIRDKKRILNV